MANCTIPPESHSAQVFSLNFFPVVSLSKTANALPAPASNESQRRSPYAFPLNEKPLSHLPLSHLGRAKREQLQKAVEVILESAHSNNASKPCMLILFGSYARGNWIEGNWIDARGNWIEEKVEKRVEKSLQTFTYQSSFDILAVTKNEALAKKIERKDSLHKRLKQEVKTPVHLIAEDIHRVNRRIGKGQYFYTDMLRDGIVLYDSGEHELAEPFELPLTECNQRTAERRKIAERRQIAEADFQHWFGKAIILKKSFALHFHEGDYSEAAFILHQIVERLYGAILLVFIRYKPDTHDLHKLGQYVASMEPPFLMVFPKTTSEERAKFTLLRNAYVSARYKPSFTITQQELEWLESRVVYLQTLTEQCCQARIASYQ